MDEKKNFYVAVSRQFGSGGGETAAKLAAKLGIHCYDKSLAEMTSVVTGFDKEVILGNEDKSTNAFWYAGFLSGESLSLYDKVYIGQSHVIRQLADKGSCVFVGRCAAKVLAEKEHLIKVFICAPMEQRIERVASGYNVTPEEAEKIIRKNDKARAAYYKKYAEMEWGKIDNYDLSVNTRVGTDKAADIIADYVHEIIKD